MKNLIKCIVCGDDVEFFGICETCNYHNSGDKETLDDNVGADKVSPREAFDNYKRYRNIYGEKNNSILR